MNSSASGTMTALVQHAYGAARVLRLARVPIPQPGPHELLVRVKAASVNQADVHLMTGRPTIMRLMGAGRKAPKVATRGVDVAGIVEKVGDAVASLAVGDEVFGAGSGSFAEFVLVRERSIAVKPAGVTFEQAAALPVAGCAALLAVRSGGVAVGQRVLVLGAGGGIGTYAVQIAHSIGAHVTAVCGTDKHDLVRSLGADTVIDYTTTDVTQSGRVFDVILDVAGGVPLDRLRRILAPRGTLVIVGAEGGGKVFGGLGRQLTALLTNPFSRQRLRSLVSAEHTATLNDLAAMVTAGSIAPAITRTYPLAEARDAVAYVARGHAAGKVVVTV